MHIHFVIPAFKESARLPTYLKTLLPTIRDSSFHITLQVVDDGSGTEEQKQLTDLLDPYISEYPFFKDPMLLKKNMGKGGAVYSGWNNAPACDMLGFVDADGSIPGKELIRLAELAAATPQQALFGSRILMLGKSITRSAKRHYIGRIFATLASTLLQVPVYDSQCGIKIIPSTVFDTFCHDCQEYGFAFDMELLMLLRRAGCTVIEQPIDWHDTPGSKVQLVRDGLRMATTLFRLRSRFITTN